MRMTRFFLLGAALLALTPGQAGAQGKRIRLNVGGGPTFNTGNLSSRFGVGWGPAIGLSFVTPKQKIEIQFEYAYRYFGSDQYTSTFVGQLSGNHQTHQLDFNLLAYLTRKESKVHVYVVGGGGLYYRKVDITKYLGSGYVCDPYWYVCGYYPVEGTIASRGGWDPGIDIGGGIGIPISSDHAEFYIESRFHYVWGPKFAGIDNGIVNIPGGTANGSYVPLTFGFRW